MKFRLVYSGELRPTQGEPRGEWPNKLAAHKHGIRREFHGQLKRLWETNRYLSTRRVSRGGEAVNANLIAGARILQTGPDVALADHVAAQNEMFGYRFVPLVRESISLLCSLDILFLRKDIPGSALHAGDLDNRVKTIIDALRRPSNATELAGNETPLGTENPFFVLLEDDKQVSALTVETDTLLDERGTASSKDTASAMAHLVITVELRPYHVTMENLSFA